MRKYILLTAILIGLGSVLLAEAAKNNSVNAQTIGAGMYPRSTYLTNITWDSQKFELSCGDNAATTWAANDFIYGTLGDCQTSFNIVQVGGNPPNFTKSVLGPRVDGQTWSCCGFSGGKQKSSGILAIGNTLYSLQRNWDGRTGVGLVVSNDGGKNFTFQPHQIKVKLGYPAFINYGQGYADAKDNYVYIWGHGCEDSAYSGCDRMHMLRVPKDQILNKSAYQYFVRMDGTTPIWANTDPGAADLLTKAGTVFRCTGSGKCDRSGITYNKGLGRYLVWMSDWNGTDDFRNPGTGGLGIYESATPWDANSWKMVWHTPTNNGGWGIFSNDGIGDAGNFITKWMSADGRQMYLAYGGRNQYSLRKATFTVNGPVQTSAPTTPPVNTPNPTVPPTTIPTTPPTAAPTGNNNYPPIDYNDDNMGFLVPLPPPTPQGTPQTTQNPQPTAAPSSQPTTPPTTGQGTFQGISNGATVSGDITVTYETDRGSTRTVEFRIDNTSIGFEGAYPYSLGGDSGSTIRPYNTRQLSDGQHTLTARVNLTSGQSFEDSITFIVNNNGSNPGPSAGPTSAPSQGPNPTNPPASDNGIAFTGITAGQQVSGRILVEAIPSFGNVNHIDFLIDGRKINSEYRAPYHMGDFVNYKPVGYDTAKLGAGSHTLTAEVYLNGGEVRRASLTFTK